LIRGMAKQIAKSVAEGDFARLSDMQREAMANLDLSASTARISVPTLVIHGEEDKIIPVPSAEELAAAIKGAQLALLPGAGHLLLAERPRELYKLVADFFAA